MSIASKPLIVEVDFPLSVLALLESLDWENGGFLLESALADKRLGRWSFLGAEPFLRFSSSGRNITIKENNRTSRKHGNPFSLLSSLLGRFALNAPPQAPPFVGGAVGYFGYDLCQLLERLPSISIDDINLPNCSLNFYDVIIAVDHHEKRAFICSSGWPETDEKRREKRAHMRIEATQERLSRAAASSEPPLRAAPGGKPLIMRCNFEKDDYLAAILRAKEYIAAGDIYQVNLSQRFSYAWGDSPVELYRRLRALNPAPFAGLLVGEDWALVGASPERFLQVRGDWVETRPIKGTRPRHKDPDEDARLAEELLISEKDRAENVMIVDLERNDLGKVCEYGTVHTTELWALERYPTVFHLVSTVEGRLRQGHDALGCLRACFPGGSITGAPKVRAMEIIEELEPTKRGPYTGAMGYLSFTGDMDVNIIIRTFALKDGCAHYQVGGGIVADSDPEAEYQETLDKGRALHWAIAGGKQES